MSKRRSPSKATANGRNRISKADLPPMAYQDVGATGLRRQSGKIDEQPLRQLKGRELETYREMARYDDVVGAALFAIEMLVRQIEWRIEPGGPDPAHEEQADFVEECLGDMSHSWEDLVGEILSMIWAGFSVFEIIYKKRGGYVPNRPGASSKYNDGRIGWRKLAPRSQDTIHKWLFDETGGVRGVEQFDWASGVRAEIPIEKLLIFRVMAYKGNPEGRSLLERSYVSWYRKSRIAEVEGIGIERDLAGMPVMRVPPEVLTGTDSNSAAVRAEYQNVIRNVRRDEQEGVLLPAAYDPESGNPLYDFELLSSGGARQFDTNEIVRRYDRAIAGTLMADFLLLGHEGVGSFALSKDKTEMFTVALATITKGIAQVFNAHAIPRLIGVNGWTADAPPRLVPGDIDRIDLEELGQFISQITGSGARLFPDAELENHLRRAARLPLAVAEGEMGRLQEDDEPERMDDQARRDAELEALLEGEG